ncbi:hypothetical protein F4809DRAFT_397901 [Biscogniauxia mediterranea]|nr:hypothetical protein F4809DRAFT_397901 [Biscogniauxia mediterranea]
MAGDLPLSPPCQTCGTTVERTFTCIQCNNLAFCEVCWPKWVLHVAGAVGWNGKPHEQADPVVVHRLRQILEPSRTEAEHEFELLEDQDTTWFGFGRDASGHPLLHDYGRFAAIMAETTTDEHGERYPQLASFIGETGAGKSTLIKLLIERQDLSSPEGSSYYSPVTSSNRDRISTTGDVHLYADPSTLYSNYPLLLVDCEGLSGGEAMPKQLRHNSQDPLRPGVDEYRPRRYSAPRRIEWAETPQTQKREFAVGQLYPRILYTFSDVVVFVLRNPRSFESSVLPKLIKWGAASIDKSINQPVLPHAIIVLNATDVDVDENEWDVTKATHLLMSDIHGAIAREPSLQEFAQTWRNRGKVINSTKDLLECYYASISVVRIPYKGSYMLMNEQVGKLADLVKNRCAASHFRKKQVRMLANTEKLQFYLQAAYDHFTRYYQTPFDFVKETLRHSPVSRNFEGNILNLALLIKEKCRNPEFRNDAEQIFRAIGPMIASCVMLDAVRQKLPGTVGRLLDDRYAKSCVGALRLFADIYWPCSFTNPAYAGDLGQCCNVRSGHNPKGHQNKHGKIIGDGDYESHFSVADFGPVWEQLLRTSLAQVQAASFKLGQEFPDRTELQNAAILHQERLNELYSNVLVSATDYVSYSACLCCLRELPECALPCGHVLCLSCIEIYGTRTSRTTIEINRCPLHVRGIISDPPWVITTKPRYAGSRTLCLDGGGIRGIIQLQVLREVEKILGSDLPIQLFFDLIVGIDTGGIIAIGLGVKKWTVNATIDKFKDLCREVFVPRKMSNVPLVGALSSLYHGSHYNTQPFEKALKRYFSEQPFFGGATHKSRLTTSNRVAVVAERAIDRQAVVFANYNRPDPLNKTLPYRFTRSDAPSKEIRMWEAARATSATSPFFKAFLKPDENQEYQNSDTRHMCPISVANHESKLIWSDIADAPPDLMLSVGAGQSVHDSGDASSSISVRNLGRSMTNDSASTGTGTAPGSPSAVIRQGRGGLGNYKRQSSNPAASGGGGGGPGPKNAASGYIVRNPQTPMLVSFNNPLVGRTERLNDQQECDKAWARFMSGGGGVGDAMAARRYMRISPDLGSKLPRFDELPKMEEAEREAEMALRQMNPGIIEIAHRLVASTFFFEKDPGSVRQTASGFTCTGSIYCRFRPCSPELQALGWFLIARLEGSFEPYFLLEEQDEGRASWPVRQLVLSESVLQDMHLQGNFHLDPVRISAASENSDVKISLCLQTRPYPSGVTVLPISGFPRKLMAEDGSVQQAPLMSPTHSSVVGRGTALSSSPTPSSIDTPRVAPLAPISSSSASAFSSGVPLSPVSNFSAATTISMAPRDRGLSPGPYVKPEISHESFRTLSLDKKQELPVELEG